MSDTAAFLAGCAVTGVAALFLARGDFAASQPRSPQLLPLPAPSLQSPAPTPGALEDTGRGWQFQTELEQQQDLSRDLTAQLKQQGDQATDLKNQLEKQQSQTEDLKGQLEKQQRNTEQLLTQLQEQQRLIDKMASQQSNRPLGAIDSQSSTLQTVALAVGAIVLVVVLVGGAILLVGVIVIVVMTRRKQTRTVHVVHPVPTPTPYPMPEPHLLPARNGRVRQPRQIDVDYYGE